MATKRTKGKGASKGAPGVERVQDPAGILPDLVRLDTALATFDEELTTFREVLRAATPRGRIDRIAAVPELAELAEGLRKRLGPNGHADNALMLDIAAAEHRALYMRAAPHVVVGKKAQRQRQRAGFSSGAERQAEREPVWKAWQRRAEELKASNPRRSKHDICEQIGREFNVTGRAVANRVNISGKERPRSN